MEIRGLEKEANEMASKDDCTTGEVRKAALQIQYKQGRFDEDFQAFMMEEGIPQRVHMVEVCQLFFQKGKKDLAL